MNVELLLKVKQHILEEPRRIDMGRWECQIFKDRIDPEYHENFPPCGTVACIAGWAIGIERGREFLHHGIYSPDIEGRRLLGLNHNQAQKLFHVKNWPPQFKNDYYNLGIYNSKQEERAKNKAAITAERIDFFIETNGLDYK